MTWSRSHEQCIACGTTELKHKGHGLCSKCHWANRYATNEKFRNLVRERAKKSYMANQERTQQRVKEYHANHPEKVREWKQRNRDKVKRLTGASHSAKYRKGQEFLAYGMKFIVNGRAVVYANAWQVPAINTLSNEFVFVPLTDIESLGPAPSLYDLKEIS